MKLFSRHLITLYAALLAVSGQAQSPGEIETMFNQRIKTEGDSVQIRLLKEHSVGPNETLTVIGKSEKGWYAEWYSFGVKSKFSIVSSVSLGSVGVQQHCFLQPETDWSTFIDTLYSLNVLNLTSKNCGDKDGYIYKFKILTHESVKEAIFDNCYADKIKGKPADSVARIIQMMSDELKRKKEK